MNLNREPRYVEPAKDMQPTRIRIIRQCFIAGNLRPVGTELTLPAWEALESVAYGKAERVQSK